MNGLDSAQVEQLQQIGEYLYHLREQQGISLEEIAESTFVPLRLLEAIEVADIDRLPEPVYVRGFIRRYADALGVDGTEIAAAFPVDAYPTPQISEELNAGQALQSDYNSAHLPQRDRPFRSWMPYIPYAAAGVIAVVAIGAIAIAASNAFRSNSPQQPETQASSSTTPVPSTRNNQTSSTSSKSSPSPDPSANPEATSRPDGESPATSAGQPVEVDVTLAEPSWMEVIIDDKVEFEGTLAKGEQRTWAGKKSVEIRAGNAGGVVVSHNQSEAKPLGKLGEVVDISFTSQGNSQGNSGDVSRQ